MDVRRFSENPIVLSLILLGAFAGSCLAPQTPSEPRLRERGPLAENYLRRRLPLWQKRLKLQDWTITLVMSHPGDLRRGTLGNCHWDAVQKTAMIRVLDASDYQMSFNATVKDMEFTLVHELTHLELSPLTRNFKSRSEESVSDEENAVNRLADAMLQLDREDEPARLRDAAAVKVSPGLARAR
jgi:hypothetical protein